MNHPIPLFQRISPEARRYSTYECPRCFSLVLGWRLDDHWWGQHQKVVLACYVPTTRMVWTQTKDEEEVARMAMINTGIIFFERVIDR